MLLSCGLPETYTTLFNARVLWPTSLTWTVITWLELALLSLIAASTLERVNGVGVWCRQCMGDALVGAAVIGRAW